MACQISSWVRQAAFFLRFNFEWNLLISNYITPQSRILYIRDVRERFQTAAPVPQVRRRSVPGAWSTARSCT